ncbi:MAG: hypothetical protein DRN18_04355 [Thermoplasmata archaeon]|nr:MAG: hypothetical protein DRN18_04355 [Thermoplasmata archaeon]
MDSERYLKIRENALRALEKAIKEEKVDPDIVDILQMINSRKDLFTTSSCSGRIVVIEVPYPGAKPGARFLGKWHREIRKEDLDEAIRKSKEGYIMFMVHPPIIHVVAVNPEIAENILKIALSSGFKNSGMRAFKGKIVVEIRSTERMDVLIGKDGKLMVGEEYLEILREMANRMLRKGKRKLQTLRKNMEEKLI